MRNWDALWNCYHRGVTQDVDNQLAALVGICHPRRRRLRISACFAANYGQATDWPDDAI